MRRVRRDVHAEVQTGRAHAHGTRGRAAVQLSRVRQHVREQPTTGRTLQDARGPEPGQVRHVRRGFTGVPRATDDHALQGAHGLAATRVPAVR